MFSPKSSIYEITRHESHSHKAERGAKAHTYNADGVLRARAFGDAPSHAESRDSVAEMENRRPHAENVKYNDERILEKALQKFK